MSEKVFSLVLLFLFRSCAHVKKVETFYDRQFCWRKQVKLSYHFRSVVIWSLVVSSGFICLVGSSGWMETKSWDLEDKIHKENIYIYIWARQRIGNRRTVCLCKWIEKPQALQWTQTPRCKRVWTCLQKRCLWLSKPNVSVSKFKN